MAVDITCQMRLSCMKRSWAATHSYTSCTVTLFSATNIHLHESSSKQAKQVDGTRACPQSAPSHAVNLIEDSGCISGISMTISRMVKHQCAAPVTPFPGHGPWGQWWPYGWGQPLRCAWLQVHAQTHGRLSACVPQLTVPATCTDVRYTHQIPSAYTVVQHVTAQCKIAGI